MADQEVRVESLPGMWVASFLAYGKTPEAEAWRQLRDWATSKGIFNDVERHPIFGFNNPAPSPERQGYGYELWIKVDEPDRHDEHVTFKRDEGGLFAVKTTRLSDIASTWRLLWDWAQSGLYHWRPAHELERVMNPGAEDKDLVLELYLPVEAAGQLAAAVGRSSEGRST